MHSFGTAFLRLQPQKGQQLRVQGVQQEQPRMGAAQQTSQRQQARRQLVAWLAPGTLTACWSGCGSPALMRAPVPPLAAAQAASAALAAPKMVFLAAAALAAAGALPLVKWQAVLEAT